MGEKRPTEIISDADVRALVDSIKTNTKRGVRDKAFILGLFGGGLRISEMLGLKLSEVRTEAGVVFLVLRKTKASKPDEQPLPPTAADAIWALKIQRQAEGAAPNDPLLISYRGIDENPHNKRLSAKTGFILFKSLAKKAGLPETISPHSARATAATQLLLSGEDYGSVKDFLRHDSFDMTARYDHRLRTRTNHPGLRLKY